MQNPTSKEVYIDGDILPYEIGFVTQRRIYMLDVEGEHTCSPFMVTRDKRKVNKLLEKMPDLLVTEFFYIEEPIQAINTLKLAIQNIVKGAKCKTFKVVLSGPSNFRTNIATILPYKGNRSEFVKPHYFDMLREWLLDKPYTIVSDYEEADDVVSRAIMAGYVGSSLDKDLNNTPGWHHNHRNKELYYIDEDTAIRNFYKQMLIGDKADNIPGIKGIGKVKSTKIIDSCVSEEDMEKVVYDYYSLHYDDPYEAMVEVGQLLWMRREEGEMWMPKYSGDHGC